MESFDAAYRAAHGVTPFPWQQRLADSEELPRLIDVPTGCGKTSVLDLLVWRSIRHGEARRVVWVVDRRLVVDDVFDHASAVATCHGIRAVKWRGGMTIDESWLLEPHERAIIVSTVDQVGSRLLFRGYGVPWKSRSVYAGLLAFDTVVVLDEVHLAPYFAHTLEEVARLAPPPTASGLGHRTPSPLRVIQMSATPVRHGDEDAADGSETPAFGLGAADLEHELLARRLGTHKRATLERAPESRFRPTIIAAAARLAEQNGVVVVGVVVNRVDDARGIFEELRDRGEALLLTGRIRPFDRALLLDGPELSRARPGRPRLPGDGPLFVVATQTVEVGVNLDFDALVTEAAPISALRQRFGRLDRLGDLGETEAAVVLRARSDQDDPVYGEDLGTAWRWLWEESREVSGGKRVIDLGLAVHHKWPDEGGRLPEDLPEIGERGAEVLAETHPYLDSDLDVATLLHGRRTEYQRVSLVWRRELDQAPTRVWSEVVDLCPPARAEALALPRWVVRDWLARHGIRALRWRPGEEGVPVSAESFRRRGAIRHEDILIVPSRFRGNDPFGWNPDLQPRRPDEPEDQDVGCHEAFRDSEAFRGLQRVEEEPEQDEMLRRFTAYPPEWGVDGGVVDRRERRERHAERETLGSHLEKARNEGEKIATTVLVDAAVLVEDLLLALGTHDVGKADQRFQVMLHDGNEIEASRAAARDAPLAKSGTDWWNVTARNRAWAASGLPRGWRHEVESLARADLSDARNEELVRHLIVVHHGRGRPWLPAAGQPEGPVAQANRFWELHRRLGPWTLAYLEALVVVADRRASEDGEEVRDAPAVAVGEVRPRKVGGDSPPVVETAFHGRTFLGFMAALGTLRLLDGQPVRLSWSEGSAQLHGLPGEDLLAALAEALELSEFAAERTCDAAGERLPWDLCRAGRTQLWNTLPDLREELCTDRDRLERTLFGPWRWSDTGDALGWVPAIRDHALRPRAPTRDNPFRENGALWLAWEGIEVYGRRPGTDRAAGWSRDEQGRWVFVWPLWDEPATLATVRSMMRSSPVRAGDLGAAEWWSTTRVQRGGRSDELTMPRPMRAEDVRRSRISANPE